MTNFERLKNMSIYEFAQELYGYIYDCNQCPCDRYNHKECYKDNCDCVNLIKEWLKKPHKKRDNGYHP